MTVIDVLKNSVIRERCSVIDDEVTKGKDAGRKLRYSMKMDEAKEV